MKLHPTKELWHSRGKCKICHTYGATLQWSLHRHPRGAVSRLEIMQCQKRAYPLCTEPETTLRARELFMT